MARLDRKGLPDQRGHKVYLELTVPMEQSDLKDLKV